MCDYSLHAVMSRDAKQGDELEVCEFHGTSTRGLRAQAIEVHADGSFGPNCAVCLQPGTEVVFDNPPPITTIWQNIWRLIHCLPPRMTRRSHTAKFVKINTDSPCTHHDAFEFMSGEQMLIQKMPIGTRLNVLQVPAVAVDDCNRDNYEYSIDYGIFVRRDPEPAGA